MHKNDDHNLDQILKQRFAKLPKVVQNAITGAHVEKHLRLLANKHKLHLDQWQLLENEVVMALMGLEQAENLQTNIQEGLGVEEELARELAEDITAEVFEPIREKLERELDHPQAQPENTEPIEDMRAEILAQAKQETTTQSTPPTQQPEGAVLKVRNDTAHTEHEPSQEEERPLVEEAPDELEDTPMPTLQKGTAPPAQPPEEDQKDLTDDISAPANSSTTEERDTSPNTTALPVPLVEETTTSKEAPIRTQNKSPDTPLTPENARDETLDTNQDKPLDNVQEKKRPVSTEYALGKPSTERNEVADDPYRESIDG